MPDKIEFISKEQSIPEETTRYWFAVNDINYCLADNNGCVSLLDNHGCPIHKENDLKNIQDNLFPLYLEKVKA